MQMISEEICAEYLALALRAVAEVRQDERVSMSTFTSCLTEMLPVTVRKRVGYPLTPNERWAWLEDNVNYQKLDDDSVELTSGNIRLLRSRRHVTISYVRGFTQDDPWSDTVVLDVTNDPADYEALEAASAAYSSGNGLFPDTTKWMPHKTIAEYDGSRPLASDERVVNLRVYCDGYISHAIDSRLGSEFIDRDTFTNIQQRIKWMLGFYSEPAHVKRENGRGGYWVIPATVLAHEGLRSIVDEMRIAFQMYGYKALFTVSWHPTPFQEQELVR